MPLLVQEAAVLAGAGTLAATLLARWSYTALFQRFRTAEEIPASAFQKGRRLAGIVTAVGDGDNFRLYHRPLFWLGRVPRKPSDLRNNTISVRLAGVDAPECAHFGAEAQPYGPEARAWLRKYLLGRNVTIQLHSRDQYQRAVCTAWVRRGLLHYNVSLALVQAGYATLYTAKGAEYGGMKAVLVRAEKAARASRRGMWKQKKSAYVSPGEFKRATK